MIDDQVHGVIFVVDSSSEKEIAEAAPVLQNAMTHATMANKPLLLYVRHILSSINYKGIDVAFSSVVSPTNATSRRLWTSRD